MSIDLNGIVDRNKVHLKKMLEYFKITVTIDELLEQYTRVYIHQDTKAQRIRLMSYKKVDDAVEEGKKKEKTKREQLVTINRKDMEKYSVEEIESIMTDMQLLVMLYREIMLSKELLHTELELGKIIEKRKGQMK